jgi:hypothetical protein
MSLYVRLNDGFLLPTDSEPDSDAAATGAVSSSSGVVADNQFGPALPPGN